RCGSLRARDEIPREQQQTTRDHEPWHERTRRWREVANHGKLRATWARRVPRRVPMTPACVAAPTRDAAVCNPLARSLDLQMLHEHQAWRVRTRRVGTAA